MSAPQPRQVAALLAELTSLGVTLPDGVADAATVLEDAANGTLARQAADPLPFDVLLHLNRAELLEEVRARAVRAKVVDDLAEAAWSVGAQIATATAALLRDKADDVLAQLRPPFERAADAVHHATTLGLHPGMTADDVIALANHDATTAWSALTGPVKVLEEIAAVRIAMTDVLDVAPAPNPFGPRVYGAAFSTHAPNMTAPWGRSESAVDKWLRLSQGESLRLLTVADTHQAAAAAFVPPVATVTPSAGGPVNEPAPARSSAGRRRSVAFLP